MDPNPGSTALFFKLDFFAKQIRWHLPEGSLLPEVQLLLPLRGLGLLLLLVLKIEPQQRDQSINKTLRGLGLLLLKIEPKQSLRLINQQNNSSMSS